MTSARRCLKIFGYVMLTILVCLVFIFVSVIVQSKTNPDKVPSIFGYKPFVVLSNSMESEVFRGDLVITKNVDFDSLEKDDIVAFKDDANHVVTHRIVNTTNQAGEKKFVTKGDNNNTDDDGFVSSDRIEGKYLFKLSGFGYLILELQKPATLIILLIVIIGAGGLWIFVGNNKLSKEEKKELEKFRREKERKSG